MTLSTDTATDLFYQPAQPQADDGPVQSLLVFQLEERSYGLFIENIVQIIPMLKLTPVPQVEQVIEGVANIHGKVVPVLSARRFLGLPFTTPGLYTPIIQMRTGERMTGLIVDNVADVIHVPASQVVLPEAILPGGRDSAAFLSGVVYQGDNAVMVLDPRFLLYPNQLRAVSKAIQAMPVKGMIAETQSNLPCPEEAQPETNLEPVIAPTLVLPPAAVAEDSAEPQNGHNKPRRKRRKLEAALAGEIASLAVDLPPSDGQPAGPADSAPDLADQQPASEE